MPNQMLTLTVVSQERKLLEVEIDSLTATTSEGEVTILPGHISLFSLLVPGELVFRTGKEEQSFVVSKGFLDVGTNNQVVVIVDTAVHARDISESKAQAAIAQAHQTMQQSQNRRELMMAEASLKLAMLELKVAQRSKKSPI